LSGKTQVVALPGEPLLRSRLGHTLEVGVMARELARGLGLVEPLAEAIALGHDIGHPAFGHAGEKALAALIPGGFHHAAHGVRVVTALEPLSLRPEVVDGILKHSKGKGGPLDTRGRSQSPFTREALVVRAADLFAYACHDLDDAYLLGALQRSDLPARATAVLGAEPSAIRHVLIDRTVRQSLAEGDLAFDPEAAEALLVLRSFLYERLYEAPRLARQTALVRVLFESVWEAARERPRTFAKVLKTAPWVTVLPRACDEGTSHDGEQTSGGAEGDPGSLATGEAGADDAITGRFFIDIMAAMTDRQVLRLGRELRLPRRVRSWPPFQATG
jgi:dGTP triphosphohydrolase